MLLWNRLFWGPIFSLLWNGMKHCHCPGVAKKANTKYMSRRPNTKFHVFVMMGEWNTPVIPDNMLKLAGLIPNQ